MRVEGGEAAFVARPRLHSYLAHGMSRIWETSRLVLFNTMEIITATADDWPADDA